MTPYLRDALMIDGRPQSANRKPRRDRSKGQADPLQTVRAKQATEAKHSLPRKAVDGSATTRKVDRSMTPEQRSALAALSRDPFLNFDYLPTLTRGQAERLIPWLQKRAKQRRREQQSQGKKQR